jgi:S1-C subfamily serine protease
MIHSSWTRIALVVTGLVTLAVSLGLEPAASQVPQRSAYARADLEALQNAFVELASEAKPSTVAIRTYRSRGKARIPLSHGSGFVIESGGILVTNHHVIAGADYISVVLHDGQGYQAEVIEQDRRSDLAVLKIPTTGLKPIQWGDVDAVRVNQWAFACGNPFGLGHDEGNNSVTFGVVSALDRRLTSRLASLPGLEYYDHLIETSCAINPGMSGGPLFNLQGEVIGVVTAMESSSGVSEGLGYAIPIDRYTRGVIDTLRAGREMHHGFLGVELDDRTGIRGPGVRRTAAFRGSRVASVSLPEGPAARAGLQVRDIIIEFDGERVRNTSHLVRMVGFTPAGTEAKVVYRRDGVTKTTTVKLGNRLVALGYDRASPNEESPARSRSRGASDNRKKEPQRSSPDGSKGTP